MFVFDYPLRNLDLVPLSGRAVTNLAAIELLLPHFELILQVLVELKNNLGFVVVHGDHSLLRLDEFLFCVVDDPGEDSLTCIFTALRDPDDLVVIRNLPEEGVVRLCGL